MWVLQQREICEIRGAQGEDGDFFFFSFLEEMEMEMEMETFVGEHLSVRERGDIDLSFPVGLKGMAYNRQID